MPLRLLPGMFAAIAAVAFGACAQAASFNCSKAKSAMERAICKSPDLSDADERMARTYERALHALSPDGVRSLRDSQRDWLRYVVDTCLSAAPGKSGARITATKCLRAEFIDRADQLDKAGLRIGPYVFNSIDLYVAAPTDGPDDTGLHPGMVTGHAAFPQIDSPRTPTTDAWNAAQRLLPPALETAEQIDLDTSYAIGCASERVVSIETWSAEYGHGAAHGAGARETRTTVLAPVPHEMAPEDLFAGEQWRIELPRLFWEAYLHDDRAITDDSALRQAILDAAVDGKHWLLTPDGLQIGFSSYEGGCYACNPGPLTVPWAVLRPMLADPAIADCKAPPKSGS